MDIQKIFPHGYTSYSQLDGYLRCPWYFKRKYVDHVKCPPNFYMTFGSALHQIFEVDGQEQMRNGQHIPKDVMLAILNCYWRHHDMCFDTAKREKEFYDRALNIIENYSKRPTLNVVGTEIEFLVNFSSLGVPIKGFIDKIYDEDGELVVVDYKSGKPYDQDKVDTSLQMSIYGMACKQMFGKYPKRYEFDFVRENRVVATYRDRGDIIAAAMFVQGTLLRMLNEEFDEKYDNAWWCSSMCEIGKLGMCNVKTETDQV